MNLFELLASGTVGSMVTGILAYFTRRQELGKMAAEIKQLRAASEMLEAQADDLVSARLIRELDRISATNDELSRMLNDQRGEIDKLRRQLITYEAREHRHKMEKEMLWQELKKFNETDSPLMIAIRAQFPLFDSLESPIVPENE